MTRLGSLPGVSLLTLFLLPSSAAADDHLLDLQALIDAAPAGSTLTLDAASYAGGVVIDKPITVDGRGMAVVDSLDSGNGIEVRSPDVTIRGLTVRATGDSLDRENAAISAYGADRLVVERCVFEDVLFGVYVRESEEVIVRYNTIGAKALDPGRRGDAIRLWESPGSLIEGNIVNGGRDSLISYSDDVVVRGNRLTNGRYGLHLMNNRRVLVEGNLLEGNSVGAFLMYSTDVVFRDNVVAGNYGPSGYGLGLKDVEGVEASGNRVVGNRVGIYLDHSPVSAGITQTFTGNLVAFNDTGVLLTPSVQNNYFSANAFVDNREQVATTGGGVSGGNFWTIDGVGNYWDDFSGYDADGDGRGDIPYKGDDLYSALAERHPEIIFFADTPAAQAIDLTARLFPTLRPEPKVVDDAPLVEMPTMAAPVPGTRAAHPGGLITVSLVMLAVAALLVLASQTPQRRSV